MNGPRIFDQERCDEESTCCKKPQDPLKLPATYPLTSSRSPQPQTTPIPRQRRCPMHTGRCPSPRILLQLTPGSPNKHAQTVILPHPRSRESPRMPHARLRNAPRRLVNLAIVRHAVCLPRLRRRARDRQKRSGREVGDHGEAGGAAVFVLARGSVNVVILGHGVAVAVGEFEFAGAISVVVFFWFFHGGEAVFFLDGAHGPFAHGAEDAAGLASGVEGLNRCNVGWRR